jgi:hypothetical protein
MRKYIAVFFMLAAYIGASAQEKMKNKGTPPPSNKTGSTTPAKSSDELSFWKNIRMGGNFSAAFGTYTYIQLTPIVGYVFNGKLFTGVSGTYIYQSEKQSNGAKISYNIYGMSAIGRYSVYEGLFLNAEYETLNYSLYDVKSNTERRVWVNSPLIGAGYISSFDNFRGPYIMVLYNLNYDPNTTPYPSSWVIRIGMLF